MNLSIRKHTPEPPAQALLRTLVLELFQTERSASLHCAREARRFPGAPPARALQDIANHARVALGELDLMTRDGNLPASRPRELLGRSIGAFLSKLRQTVLDRLVDAERSYRGTILGVRHGVDLVRLVQSTALGSGDYDLARWCSRWLDRREAMLQRAVDELVWFAENPELAVRTPLPRILATR